MDVVRSLDEDEEQRDLQQALANSLEAPAGVESSDISSIDALAKEAERWKKERERRAAALMEDQMGILNRSLGAVSRPVVPEAESLVQTPVLAAGVQAGTADDAGRPSGSAVVDFKNFEEFNMFILLVSRRLVNGPSSLQ